MGMTGTTFGQRGQYVETTDHGDHMGTFWGLWGRGDDRDNGDDVGRPQTMETTWGPSGGYGDDGGMTWGRCEDNRDHVGTTKSLKMP